MSFYSRHILPRLVESSCATKPVMRQREKVVPLAEGRVLEIGAGGGLNLPFYDRDRVSMVLGLDLSPELLASAERKARETGLDFRPLLENAEAIPLEKAEVDCVVVTYSLCSVDHLNTALSEAWRVLKPGGALIFCEHGAAPDARVYRTQRWLTPLWKRIGGNCHLDRDIPGAIRQAGFKIDWMDSMYLPGTARFAGFNNWGVAVHG